MPIFEYCGLFRYFSKFLGLQRHRTVSLDTYRTSFTVVSSAAEKRPRSNVMMSRANPHDRGLGDQPDRSPSVVGCAHADGGPRKLFPRVRGQRNGVRHVIVGTLSGGNNHQGKDNTFSMCFRYAARFISTVVRRGFSSDNDLV